jgi:hypothetical protein
MPHALSPIQAQTIQFMLAQDLPHTLIATEVKCSVRQVGRIKANIILHGTVRPPKVVHQGRNYKVTAEMEDVHIPGVFA